MAGVKARFWVSQIIKFGSVKNIAVKLNAVTRKTEDNVDWAKYSPAGEINVTVTEDTPAQAWFEDRLGKDVAITFDDVPSE